MPDPDQNPTTNTPTGVPADWTDCPRCGAMRFYPSGRCMQDCVVRDAERQSTHNQTTDPDCPRCRGGGCDWCGNTGRNHVLMPASDANDLDAVVHALGIEDSDTTPAEAVAELHAEIERLRAIVAQETTP